MHIAIQIFTALREILTKLFTFRCCFSHLKNNSICHLDL